MKLYMLDGVAYTYEEVKRDYVDTCRDCAHYDEEEPSWEEWRSEYKVIEA